jgi:hypothetical protein
MRRPMLMSIPILGILLGAGLVAAQTPAPAAKDEHAAHHPDQAPAAAGKGKAAKGSPEGMGKMGMGGGMMGGGMMGGGAMMCPGMMGDAKLEVTKLPKGVTLTLTSDDPKVVARVQKMAEGMRLMHEANTP